MDEKTVAFLDKVAEFILTFYEEELLECMMNMEK